MRLTDEEKDMFLSALAREMKVQLEKNNRDLLIICKNLQDKILKSELWTGDEVLPLNIICNAIKNHK